MLTFGWYTCGQRGQQRKTGGVVRPRLDLTGPATGAIPPPQQNPIKVHSDNKTKQQFKANPYLGGELDLGRLERVLYGEEARRRKSTKEINKRRATTQGQQRDRKIGRGTKTKPNTKNQKTKSSDTLRELDGKREDATLVRGLGRANDGGHPCDFLI